MGSKTMVQSVADTANGLVLANVQVGTAPHEIFRALTTPGEIVEWWGANDVYRLASWTGDLRPGGAWCADGRQADGATFSVEGEFLEIEAPHRLSHTWKADWDQGGAATITYTIEAADGGCLVTLRHQGSASHPGETLGYAEGWKMVLGWLADHFSPVRADPRYFHLRLVPPRTTFPQDMSAQEHDTMQEHFTYWGKLSAAGTVVVYGPVDDPAGTWGLAVVRVADEVEAQGLMRNDPMIKADLGFRYESAPLAQALIGA